MYDCKCDIFSAGVLFYMLLTGKQPFQESNYNGILRLNKLARIDFSVDELKFYDTSVLELLINMLQIDPTMRLSAKGCLMFQYFNDSIENLDIFNTEN